MAKVIDLAGRKKVKEDLGKKEKLEGLQNLLRCNLCAMRCAKCGTHGDPTTHVTHPGSGVEFRLCSACYIEYQDLLSCLNAGNNQEEPPFWFNREWIRQWLAWLDYQWALGNYFNSQEVLQVITELSQPEDD